MKQYIAVTELTRILNNELSSLNHRGNDCIQCAIDEIEIIKDKVKSAPKLKA